MVESGFEYNSKQFESDPEWAEAIKLHRWQQFVNKGHYKRQKGVIYFDIFCYNLIEAEIAYRHNVAAAQN